MVLEQGNGHKALDYPEWEGGGAALRRWEGADRGPGKRNRHSPGGANMMADTIAPPVAAKVSVPKLGFPGSL